MRHLKIKQAVALLVLFAVAGIVAFGRVNNDPPTDQEKEFAVQTADLLQAEVFAALLQEFGETTPENVEQGKRAVSLVFHDANRDIRLIGNAEPLLGGNNNVPLTTSSGRRWRSPSRARATRRSSATATAGTTAAQSR